MTGRSLHDALLRVLTSAELRRRLAAAEVEGLRAVLGAREVEALRGADAVRLGRLARFLGRHFYRERIVRLFAASRVLARARCDDPLGVLDSAAFGALLDAAEVGSIATAEAVAALVEARLLGVLGDLAHAGDLLHYEGALFRAEAGPRRWSDGHRPPGEVPHRSPSARVLALSWDVTGLVAAARRGDGALPIPPQGATRLLVALSPDGRVTTARCPDTVERLLDALDGTRSVGQVAALLGLGESETSRLLGQLAAIGAVAWAEPAPGRSDPGGWTGATSTRPSSPSSGSAR